MRMLSDDASSTAPPPLLTPVSALRPLTGRTMLPPEGGGGSASVYPDSNMVIILAALLCVLVFALGLNSVLRCARHCGRSLAMSAATPATTRITTMVVVTAAPAASGSGLHKRELRKIPVVEYETSKAGGVPDTDTTECAICLGDFVDGEKVRLLPRCRHGFHVSCIDTWLAAHSSCPICRNSLLEGDDHGAGEATASEDEAT